MKIIQVHNYYQQAGGEDVVAAAERELLEQNGHVVIPFYKNNQDVGSGLLAMVKTSVKTVWNMKSYREFRRMLRKERPDVVHCHNTFPIISPSIYWAAAREKVPVVQTIHNFRMLCATPFLFRNGQVCERCVGKYLPYPAIAFRCYRKSLAGSMVWTLMVLVHRLLGTWARKVTGHIVLTEFQKLKMIEGGLPADKIWVKPNFVTVEERFKGEMLNAGHETTPDRIEPDTGAPYALFVGRLSPEKGCDVLIRAWERLQKELLANRSELTPWLLIVGDGPEKEALEALAAGLKTSDATPQSICFLGRKSKNEVLSLMESACFLAFPSIWYETFGLTVLEAGLVSTPSIISSPTATSSLIDDGETGMLFPIGSDEVLTEKLAWAFEHPEEMKRMGQQARAAFSEKYSAHSNYQALMDIYEQIMIR